MRSEKQLLFHEIKDDVTSSKGIIVTNYKQIEPNQSWEFRQSLNNVGASLEVVKKRIFVKVAQDCGIDVTHDQLDGHIALILSGKDTIETTKTIFDFSKKNNELFGVLFGFFDERLYSPSEMKTLSTLPSQQEIRAQLLGLFEAPAQQTLGVIHSLLTSVIHCLENKAEKS